MTMRCCGARPSPDRSACGLVSGRALALQLFGGDGAHAACLEVFEGLDDLLAGVHDEGAVAGDRFADGEAAEDEDLPAVRAGEGLAVGGADEEAVAGALVVGAAEDGELAFVQGDLFDADRPVAGEDVDERVELARPGQGEPRAGRDGGVQVVDGRVGDAGAVVAGEGAGDDADEGRCRRRRRPV